MPWTQYNDILCFTFSKKRMVSKYSLPVFFLIAKTFCETKLTISVFTICLVFLYMGLKIKKSEKLRNHPLLGKLLFW